MLDIKAILGTYNIHFVEHGPNTSKGYVGLSCVLCNKTNNPDHSEHLQVNLTNGLWHCWRDPKHRGNVYRLLYLLGIKIDTFINPFEFKVQPKEETQVCYHLPETFVPIGNSVLDVPYRKYLEMRGLNPDWAITKYRIHRSRDNDKWAGRLIIPIYVNEEVTWVARAIDPRNPLRYLTPGKKDAGNVKDTIFNYNQLKNSSGQGLIIVEGVFDSISLSRTSEEEGFYSTCLFGMMATNTQLKLLARVAPKFDRIFLALDSGTESQMFSLAESLGNFGPLLYQIEGKDFGSMTTQEIGFALDKLKEMC